MLTLTTPEPMFKIGDRVKLAKFDGTNITGIVIEVSGKIYVKWPSDTAYSHWEHELVKIDPINGNDILKDMCEI